MKWRRWSNEHITKRDIPLFYVNKELNQLFTKENKNGDLRILRHTLMEELIISEVSKVYNSFIENKSDFEYDRLIYIVYTYSNLLLEQLKAKIQAHNNNIIIPLYIGKTETIGVNGKYSANIKGVQNKANKTKFARWGDGTAYHIGDLSDALFDNSKSINFNKYQKWAEFFFEKRNIHSKDLVIPKFPVYFWIKAWHKYDRSLIINLPCSTTLLEGQLIAFAKILFGQFLLNIK